MTIQLNTIIPSIFNKIRQDATMLSIMKYRDNFEGLADYSIVFHINYINAVKRSKQILEGISTKNSLEKLAKQELVESFDDTLSGKKNPRDTSSHAYEPICDPKLQIIKGVRWHTDFSRIYLYGFIVHKRIIEHANYKNDNRMPLKIVKDEMRSKLPVSRFRQFILIPGRFEKLSVEKMELTEQDLMRELEVHKLYNEPSV